MGCGASAEDRFASAILVQSDPGQLWNLLSIEMEDPTKVEIQQKIVQDNGSPSNQIIFTSLTPVLACVLVLGNDNYATSSPTLVAPNRTRSSIRTDEVRHQMLKMLVNAGAKISTTNQAHHKKHQHHSTCPATPLLLATMNFFPECVRYIVSQKGGMTGVFERSYFQNSAGFTGVQGVNGMSPLDFICRAHREPQRFYLSDEQQTKALEKMAELLITKEVVDKINVELLTDSAVASSSTAKFNQDTLWAFDGKSEAFSLFLASITANDSHMTYLSPVVNDSATPKNAQDASLPSKLTQFFNNTLQDGNSSSSSNLLPPAYGPALTAAARQFLKHGLDLSYYAPLLGQQRNNFFCPLWLEIQRLGGRISSREGHPDLGKYHSGLRDETYLSALSEQEKNAFVKLIVTSAISLISRESGPTSSASITGGGDNMFDNKVLASAANDEALCYHLETEINQIGASTFLIGIRFAKGSLVELLRRKILIFYAGGSGENGGKMNPLHRNNNNEVDEMKKSFAFSMRREVETFLRTFNARAQLVAVAHLHGREEEIAQIYATVGNDILNQMLAR